jgi:hypothetical protein
MKKKTSKGCLIAIVSLVAVLFGLFTILNWMLSDHVFRYGSLNYWIFTDSEVRELPIVGAKRTDVLYIMEVSDGPKPPILSLRYTSKNNPQKILEIYKTYYAKLGYSLAPPDQLSERHLEYMGKGTTDTIGISVEPDEKSGNLVRIYYILKV